MVKIGDGETKYPLVKHDRTDWRPDAILRALLVIGYRNYISIEEKKRNTRSVLIWNDTLSLGVS